jgi:hypothetical protein
VADARLVKMHEDLIGRILVIRGERVLIDADLAELYGVTTKALNQAVRRNSSRFPPDFVFQLTVEEKIEVVTNCDHLARLKYSKALPHAFTEHGALMLGNVLNSAKAVEVSLLVVRTFMQLREMLATHKELALTLDALERRVSMHDETIVNLVEAIRTLLNPATPRKRSIGFTADLDAKN